MDKNREKVDIVFRNKVIQLCGWFYRDPHICAGIKLFINIAGLQMILCLMDVVMLFVQEKIACLGMFLDPCWHGVHNDWFRY